MSHQDSHEEEKKEDGKVEGHNVLDKLIKLDRRNSTFDFVDELHNTRMKIRAGQPPGPPPPKNQSHLRAYWRHCSNFYFKRIEEQQFARLDYLRRMLAATITDPQRLYYDWETFLAINDVIGERKPTTPLQQLDQDNLLKHLFIDYTLFNLPEGTDKKFVTKLKQFVKEKEQLTPKNKNDKYYEAELEKEAKRLGEMVRYLLADEADDQEDDVQRELRLEMEKLEIVNSDNKDRVADLTEKCYLEVKQKAVLYFMNGVEEARLQDFSNRQLMEDALHNVRMANKVDIQITFLKEQILKLDRRQVAESISRIVRCQKQRGCTIAQNVEYLYELVFDLSLGLQHYTCPEKEVHTLNELREFSLLKFHNTAQKAMFSNISHVISGFGHLYKRRNSENLFKNRDLLEAMKRSTENAEVANKFATFEICHHCKLLYEKHCLVNCSYRSSKMGTPISTPAYSDPYLQQIIDNDSNGGSQRHFADKRRNPFMNYTKKGNEYVCLRKYCKNCIKHSYENIDKGGLCAFCQGLCFCTRCLRNDMITKLRTIYSQYGGDLVELKQLSLLERLAESPAEEQAEESISRKQLRKQNRPKKGPAARPKSSVKIYNHLRDIREQMEQCRLICHLVKRRETQKLKLFDRQFELFRNKLGQLDEEGELRKRLSVFEREINDVPSGETAADDQQEPQRGNTASNAVRKKLRRVVGGLQ